jgi:peptide/nickel transport system permease protein
MSSPVPVSTETMLKSPTPPAVPLDQGAGRKRRKALALPRSGKVIAGLVILLIFIVLAIVGPMVAPYNPSSSNFALSQAPSAHHLLGTTSLGQDVLSQLLVGARPTLIVGFVAGAIATLLSTVIGVTAGYLGGATDETLSLASNVFLAIPGLPLLIVIDAYLPQGARSNVLMIGAIISLTGWAWGARVLRALTLSLRNRDFVEASRIIGEKRFRIIFVEVVPNLFAVLASSFLFTVLYSIGTYVALAYIGVTDSAQWNWGTMLFWAQANNAAIANQWWWFLPPGLCIALVGMALALLNFGIDEFINPRLRAAGVTGRYARKVRLSNRARLGLTPVLERSR